MSRGRLFQGTVIEFAPSDTRDNMPVGGHGLIRCIGMPNPVFYWIDDGRLFRRENRSIVFHTTMLAREPRIGDPVMFEYQLNPQERELRHYARQWGFESDYKAAATEIHHTEFRVIELHRDGNLREVSNKTLWVGDSVKAFQRVSHRFHFGIAALAREQGAIETVLQMRKGSVWQRSSLSDWHE